MTESGNVVLRREGGLARVTLNRSKAINALTLDMIESTAAALDDWEQDPAVEAVLIDGAGDRGLCAGADIAELRRSVLRGDGLAERFFRAEYHVNARLAEYPKPVIALMDGIVMGGGVGLSGHVRHRVATERLVWGMPEAGIGFVPDVGGTLLLARAPGELGAYLALTAGRATAGDALACGFADTFITSGEVDGLADALRRDDPLAALAAAEARSGPRPSAPLLDQRAWIDACFAGDDAEVIEARMHAAGRDEALAALRVVSPTSVKVTLAAVRQASGLASLRAALQAEMRVVMAMTTRPDFVEGIRAMVVDKERQPRWSPKSLGEVDDNVVAELLAGPKGLAPLWSNAWSAPILPPTRVTGVRDP